MQEIKINPNELQEAIKNGFKDALKETEILEKLNKLDKINERRRMF